jgi:Flp pilus assembly protein TadD
MGIFERLREKKFQDDWDHYLSELIKQDESFTEMMAKGSDHDNNGNYKEAVKCYSKAIECRPSEGYAWFRKAKALKAIGRSKEADEAFAKAGSLGYEEGYEELRRDGK